MKQYSLLLVFVLIVLAGRSQSARADISITSVILDGRDYAWAPKQLVAPKNPNQEVNVSTGGREIKLPNQPAQPPKPFIKCTITVQNAAGNDAAQEVMVLLVLPGEVAGGSDYPNIVAKKISPNSPHPGHIQFNLGQLAGGQTKTVDFTFHRSPYFTNRVSAFVVASSSDPNPVNNYREASY
jgi:hypothetical protein